MPASALTTITPLEMISLREYNITFRCGVKIFRLKRAVIHGVGKYLSTAEKTQSFIRYSERSSNRAE
jgi:hypothetical protein